MEARHENLKVTAPYRDAMRANLAADLGLPVDAASVKATTTEGMGFIGRGQGIACHAVVVIEAIPAPWALPRRKSDIRDSETDHHRISVSDALHAADTMVISTLPR